MIDFNSDYERGVFDEAYKEGKLEGKKKGKEERERIIKLIDETIEEYIIKYDNDTIVRNDTLRKLKEELEK